MKPIPCLKGYTYTIIGSMFLFFGVLVLLVPKKAKIPQRVSKKEDFKVNARTHTLAKSLPN